MVAFSSIPSAEKKQLKSLVLSLGGHVASEWNKDCTHLIMSQLSVTIKVIEQYPQIGQLYGIKTKAAIRFTFDLHCKTIAALFCIPYRILLFENIARYCKAKQKLHKVLVGCDLQAE